MIKERVVQRDEGREGNLKHATVVCSFVQIISHIVHPDIIILNYFYYTAAGSI